jgi:hypothetical protein
VGGGGDQIEGLTNREEREGEGVAGEKVEESVRPQELRIRVLQGQKVGHLWSKDGAGGFLEGSSGWWTKCWRGWRDVSERLSCLFLSRVSTL